MVILEELQKIFVQLYIGGKNTIITDNLFHVTHIRVDQHMYASEVGVLILTMLSE